MAKMSDSDMMRSMPYTGPKTDDREMVGETDMPPCPACGTNDWQMNPDGSADCPKCGYHATPEELARMQSGGGNNAPSDMMVSDSDYA